MVHPPLTVADLLLKPLVEPLGDFTQEDAGFAARIEEGGLFVVPQFRWKQVKDPVR